MMSADVSRLKQVVELIRRGKTEPARKALVEILRTKPNNSQAWYLLSFTVGDRKQKIYALQQALRVDPEFERARERLADLLGAPPEATPSSKPAETKPAQTATSARKAPSTPSVFDSPVSALGTLSAEESSISKLQSPESVFREETTEPKPSGQGARNLVVALVLLVVFGVIFVLSRDFFASFLAGRPAAATETEVQAFHPLPPTWTPSVPLQETPQATEVSNQQALLLPPQDPAVLAQMGSIQDQVSAQRGLQLSQPVENGLVPAEKAKKILSALYLEPGTPQALSDDEQVLAALDLLPANYDLEEYFLGSHADRFGGLYSPDLTRIYTFGDAFSGIWPFAYARQAAAALLFQNFDLSRIKNEPCLPFSDTCRALKAFVSGDIELLSQDWLNAFAPAETFQAVQNAAPSAMLLETTPAAQFTLSDLTFLYDQGTNFVRTVFDVGGWSQVNLAYKNPPATTEQIMHPEKYFAGEAGISFVDPSIGDGLGSGWEPIGNGELGEWLTYLLLSQSENINARLPDDQALAAAAGWGGDFLQAYRRQVDGVVALADHWLMDSDADASELAAALRSMLSLRFGGPTIALGNGTCWKLSSQQTCVFSSGAEILWLLGPNEDATMQAMLSQYPQFQ